MATFNEIPDSARCINDECVSDDRNISFSGAGRVADNQELMSGVQSRVHQVTATYAGVGEEARRYLDPVADRPITEA